MMALCCYSSALRSNKKVLKPKSRLQTDLRKDNESSIKNCGFKVKDVMVILVRFYVFTYNL